CGSLFIICASFFYPLLQHTSSHGHYAFKLFSPWIQPFSTQKNFILSLILLSVIMLSIAVGFSLPHGISKTVLSDDKRSKPNQGVWNSVRNSMLLASFFAFLIFAIINLIIFFLHYFIGSPLLE